MSLNFVGIFCLQLSMRYWVSLNVGDCIKLDGVCSNVSRMFFEHACNEAMNAQCAVLVVDVNPIPPF